MKFQDKPWFTYFVILSVFLVSIACSQDTISLLALTQTAVTAEELGITVAPLNGDLQVQESADQIGSVSGEMDMPTEVDWDPFLTPTISAFPTLNLTQTPALQYVSMQGDTLTTLASRFNVQADEILYDGEYSSWGYLPVGATLWVPNRIGETGPVEVLMPDSEVVYSPSAAWFSIEEYVNSAGGYLSRYQESTTRGTRTGAEIIQRAATVYSINPRLLLTLIEYHSGWVFSSPATETQEKYPLGYLDTNYQGLEKQLNWACSMLAQGYYGWRSGSVVQVTFPDGGSLRISPYVNAGTAAIEYYFATLQNVEFWFDTLYGAKTFLNLHTQMFGDSWARAAEVEPFLDDSTNPPEFELPFPAGHAWNFTGGPHEAWGAGTAWAALDFAPMGVSGCNPSNEWITASYGGIVTRSEEATVVVDSDMDGSEQTGWVIFYFHVQTAGRIPAGVVVETGDPLGHPSCEGGNATGTHVHIARKYNGEWIAAGGPGLPYNMSGWVAYNGPAVYQGILVKNEEVIKSSRVSSIESSVLRPED